jgi:hypothetical protein
MRGEVRISPPLPPDKHQTIKMFDGDRSIYSPPRLIRSCRCRRKNGQDGQKALH